MNQRSAKACSDRGTGQSVAQSTRFECCSPGTAFPRCPNSPKGGTLNFCWALSGGEAVPSFEADSAHKESQVADGVLTRVRLLSKAVTAICDDKLRPFGISATQFTLLMAVCRIEPVTRAEIARLQHLNKSTLTRDLKAVLSEGWIEEVQESANGRRRPVALTRAGKELMLNAQPVWLTAQVQVEALLGEDGMIALISITDRILDHSTSRASVTSAESRAARHMPWSVGTGQPGNSPAEISPKVDRLPSLEVDSSMAEFRDCGSAQGRPSVPE